RPPRPVRLYRRDPDHSCSRDLGLVFSRTKDSRNVVMFLLENLSVSCYWFCTMKIQSFGEHLEFYAAAEPSWFPATAFTPAPQNLYGQSSRCGRRPPGVEGGHD